MASQWDEYDHAHARSPQQFETYYHCYPFYTINKPHLENSAKIIMPATALDTLMSLRIDFPFFFAIENHHSNRQSHCGVLEFTAEEGSVIMPEWMMKNMKLEAGDLVFVRSANLEKGTYMKLRPHAKSFFDISNPRVLLEVQLRNFSCLTAGDTIMIMYGDKRFYFDVVETKPCNAIDIIDTDCEVDFAMALDDKIPEKVSRCTTPVVAAKRGEKDVEATKEEETFKAFFGVGRRLDGKPMIASLNEEFSKVRIVDDKPKGKGINGKLVFGSSRNNAERKEEGHKQQGQKEVTMKVEGFQPFTGKKYTLLG